MASPGQQYNALLSFSGPPEAAIQAYVAAISGVGDYQVTASGPTSLTATRRYTPTWAIVLAILGVLFFLIGLLFLLVKNTETLTIHASPAGENLTRVQVNGAATPLLAQRLQSVGGTPIAA